MFSKVFLAMTARETAKYHSEKTAYMALHFSPYNKGLSNIPADLPKGSILLLDDSTPPENHEPQVVAEQLSSLIAQLSPSAVLLDFQRPRTEELEAMAASITQALPCPVAVTENYAKKLQCPVFLSPPPVNKPLRDYLQPWLAQGVYLEIAPEGLRFTVTETGSTPESISVIPGLSLEDKKLRCHYGVEVFQEKAVFTLCRYKEDLQALVEEAEQLGIFGCVGLYCELQG